MLEKLIDKLETDKKLQLGIWYGSFVTAVIFGIVSLFVLNNWFELLSSIRYRLEHSYNSSFVGYIVALIFPVLFLASLILTFFSGMKYRENDDGMGRTLILCAIVTSAIGFASRIFTLVRSLILVLKTYSLNIVDLDVSIFIVPIVLNSIILAYMAFSMFSYYRSQTGSSDEWWTQPKGKALVCCGFFLLCFLIPYVWKWNTYGYLSNMFFCLSVLSLSVMTAIGPTLVEKKTETTVESSLSEEEETEAETVSEEIPESEDGSNQGKKVTLRNNAGLTKTVKVGFSWTGLFFGPFVPMVRGDWRGFFIWLLVDIVTAGIGWLIFPFVYNKTYINRIIEKRGYLPATKGDMKYLNSRGISVSKTYKP